MAKRNTMIGQTVLWFPRADPEAGARPAIATGPEYEHPDGLLNLTIFREHALSITTERNVRHVDDPVLITHPRMKQPGGWEFLEKGEKSERRGRARKAGKTEPKPEPVGSET